MMDDLERISEQVNFLYDQHQDVKRQCVDLYEQLHGSLQETLASLHGDEHKDDREALSAAINALESAQEKYIEEIDADLDYLQEQIKLINNMTPEADPARRKAYVEFLMGEDIEVQDTEEYKRDLQLEAQQAVAGFAAIIEDFQTALAEERYDELAAYAESILEESEDEEEEHEEEGCCDDQENEEGCELGEDFLTTLKEMMAHAEGTSEDECCGGKRSCGDGCKCEEQGGCK